MTFGTKIAKCVVAGDGRIHVRCANTGAGMSFADMAELVRSVKAARVEDEESKKERQLLLALGDHLDVDPTLSNPGLLAGKTFYIEKTALSEAASLAADFG